jgi:hypothetical protein
MKKPKKPRRYASRKKSGPPRALKRGDAYQNAVAAVARSLDPSADVDVGVWTEGPDGRRDLDVRIRPTQGDPSRFTVIECKDWDRPIGIAFIDALDSKRGDIGASVAMICSNSGFTADALRKAARVGIPALAALMEGDSRIRVVVREQIYTPIATVLRFETSFHYSDSSGDHESVLAPPVYTAEWTYLGKSLEAWSVRKFLEIAGYPPVSKSFSARCTFREPIGFEIRGSIIPLNAIDIRGALTVQWMTQVAEISASRGMYDYLRKVVISGPGHFQFHFKNLNTETWGTAIGIEDVPSELLVPMDQRPAPPSDVPFPDLTLGMFKNIPLVNPGDAAEIDQFVVNCEIVDVP